MDFRIYHKTRDQIKKIQLKKIKRIVTCAYEKSDFYRQYYDGAGFHPDMLKTYEDIQKIPIVKRAMLKNAPTESVVTRRDYSKLHLHTTSGSSGIPVRFYYDNRELFLKNYGVMRAYFKMGVGLRDVTVAFRDPIDIRKPGIYEKLGIMAYDYYNIYDPISESCDKICKKYRVIPVMKGMPSDLLNLAYYVRQNNVSFPKIKILISDCEVLDEFSRQYIEETFGTQILDYYASVENGCIAHQLPGSSKYFVNEDQVLIENAKEDDSVGDVIITNLRNTTFPIIRYQLGDVVDFGDGKSDLSDITLRTIDKIYGKYLDFIVLPDKRIISPHVPKQELTHLTGIKRFQIIQDELDHLSVVVQKDVDYTEKTEREIIERLNKSFDSMLKIDVTYDDDLGHKVSGRKFKVIQSNIAQQFLSEEKW